jgi:hypothetical protein
LPASYPSAAAGAVGCNATLGGGFSFQAQDRSVGPAHLAPRTRWRATERLLRDLRVANASLLTRSLAAHGTVQPLVLTGGAAIEARGTPIRTPTTLLLFLAAA